MKIFVLATLLIAPVAYAGNEYPPEHVDFPHYLYKDMQLEYFRYGTVSEESLKAAQEAANKSDRQNDHVRKEKARSACLESKAANLVWLNNNIIFELRRKQANLDAIEKDKKAAKISGYANARLRHAAASAIVSSDDRIKKLYASYKSLGGKQTNIHAMQLQDTKCTDADIGLAATTSEISLDQLNNLMAYDLAHQLEQGEWTQMTPEQVSNCAPGVKDKIAYREDFPNGMILDFVVHPSIEQTYILNLDNTLTDDQKHQSNRMMNEIVKLCTNFKTIVKGKIEIDLPKRPPRPPMPPSHLPPPTVYTVSPHPID